MWFLLCAPELVDLLARVLSPRKSFVPYKLLLLAMNFYPQWLRAVSLPNTCAHPGHVLWPPKKRHASWRYLQKGNAKSSNLWDAVFQIKKSRKLSLSHRTRRKRTSIGL